MTRESAKETSGARESASPATEDGGQAPTAPPEPKTGEAVSGPRRGIEAPADGTVVELVADERSIHERMVAILGELEAIGKSSRNEQQGFMYRSHDDVLNALNPLLAEHGVFVVPTVLERATDKRTTARGSIMYEVNLHVLYTFYGPAGDSVQASAWGEGTDSGDKSTNKAMTMAFKNVLAQAFAVSTQESQRYDADASTPEETVAVAAAPDASSSDRANRLRTRIGELCDELDEKTKSEKGSWRKLVGEAVQRDFGVAITALRVGELEEVGQTLKTQIEDTTGEKPETIEFRVPL